MWVKNELSDCTFSGVCYKRHMQPIAKQYHQHPHSIQLVELPAGGKGSDRKIKLSLDHPKCSAMTGLQSSVHVVESVLVFILLLLIFAFNGLFI